jgi:hypothetical protein
MRIERPTIMRAGSPQVGSVSVHEGGRGVSPADTSHERREAICSPGFAFLTGLWKIRLDLFDFT